jgi:hypothetical protein
MLSLTDKEHEQKKKPFALYLVLGILVIVSIMSVLSFTNPEILIGWYLDDDIRKQLLDTHQLWQNATYINTRIIFDNDEIVDLRVSRAIDVFNELFVDYERTHSINIDTNQDTVILELRWKVDKDL